MKTNNKNIAGLSKTKIEGAAIDITERKRAEEALRKAHGKLEHRVQERTAELAEANERLAREIEEHKQAQEALQESELWMRSIFNSLEEAVFVVTPDRTLVNMNRSAQKMFGYTKDELVDLSTEVLHVDHEHYIEFGRRIKEAFDKEEAASFEFEVKRKNGEIFPTDHTVSLLKNDMGESVGMVSVVGDITERKRLEDELSVVYDAIASSVNGVIITDLKGKIWYANPAFLRMFKYEDRDEVIGKYASELFPSEEVQKFSDVQAIIDRVEGETEEFAACRKDGTVFNVKVSSSVVTDKEGNDTGRMASFVDITERKRVEEELKQYHEHLEELVEERTSELRRTNEQLEQEITERKRTEEALRESEQKFRSLVETTSDWVWEVDPNGIYTYAGLKVKDLLGFEPEEVIGKTPFDLMPPDEAERVTGLFRNIVESRKSFERLENTNLHKDGRQVVLETSGVPILDAGGNFLGYRGIDRDITERKWAEEKIKGQNEFLINVIESFAHPFYVLDANNYRIKMANFAAHLGSLSEHSTCYALTHKRSKPCGGAEHLCPLEEVKKTRKSVIVEHIHYDEDGNARVVEVHGHPIFDDEGNVIQMIEYSLDITERKRAEEKLLESEIKFRTLVEHLPAITYTAALDGSSTTLYVSPQIEKILGISPAEYKADPDFWVKHLHPDDRKRVLDELSRSHESGQPFISEYRMITKDGRSIWLSDDAVIARDDKGNPLCLQGVMFDITERKKVEGALRESEERFRSLTETTSDWVWAVDPNGIYTYASLKVKDLLGFEPEEVIGKTPFDLMPPDEAERVTGLFRNIVESRKPFEQLENTNLHKDGRQVVLETSGVPILNAGGNLLGYRGIDRDITERKRAEEALQKRTHDLGERVKELNCLYGISMHAEKQDISLEEILQEIVNLIPPGWQYPEITCARIVLEDRVFKTSNFKRTIWKQDAEMMAHGDKLGFLEVCYLEEKPETDEGPFLREERNLINDIAKRVGKITERKRAEEEIRKKNKELEDFVYMVSHDLKNPVVSIQGLCSLLMKKHQEDLNEKILFYIDRVQANASLMASLLEDLVELSRIGRIEDKKTEISVQEVIESVWGGVSRSLSAEDVEFILPENLPQVFYSEKRLYQIFYNLLSNAVKFKDEDKKPKVEIGCQDNKADYTFFVRDNGIGIEREYHDKIFEVFSQLKDTESEGTGMGLSIVKKIVEANQGKVWVESQKGVGSTFYFTIPKKV